MPQGLRPRTEYAGAYGLGKRMGAGKPHGKLIRLAGRAICEIPHLVQVSYFCILS